MAKAKFSVPITRVAQEAKETFVAPKPLASNEDVRAHVIQEAQPAAPVRPLRKVCTIQKVGGFSFFTTEKDREALDFIAFRNKFEKQNVVRTALHQFLLQHYREGAGLDEQAVRMIGEFEAGIYRYE